MIIAHLKTILIIGLFISFLMLCARYALIVSMIIGALLSVALVVLIYYVVYRAVRQKQKPVKYKIGKTNYE